MSTMSGATRFMAGLTLIAVPTIEFGGLFLLTSLVDRDSGYMANALRQNFFRAGHAHAGVITVLSLVCQLLVDAAVLPRALQWLVRIGVPLAGISMSAGFFTSMGPPNATAPGPTVALVYLGGALLAVSVLCLGVGLIRRPSPVPDPAYTRPLAKA
jgi:hypothetical protein